MDNVYAMTHMQTLYLKPNYYFLSHIRRPELLISAKYAFNVNRLSMVAMLRPNMMKLLSAL